MATKVSMLGAMCISERNPETKNALLISITIMAINISIIARPIWLWLRKLGNGHESILCPIVIYISASRNPTDQINRFTSFGVSLSFRDCSFSSARFTPIFFSPPRLAPYPAFSTASIISDDEADPSTVISLVNNDTLTLSTPSSLDTAFSTWA